MDSCATFSLKYLNHSITLSIPLLSLVNDSCVSGGIGFNLDSKLADASNGLVVKTANGIDDARRRYRVQERFGISNLSKLPELILLLD